MLGHPGPTPQVAHFSLVFFPGPPGLTTNEIAPIGMGVLCKETITNSLLLSKHIPTVWPAESITRSFAAAFFFAEEMFIALTFGHLRRFMVYMQNILYLFGKLQGRIGGKVRQTQVSSRKYVKLLNYLKSKS